MITSFFARNVPTSWDNLCDKSYMLGKTNGSSLHVLPDINPVRVNYQSLDLFLFLLGKELELGLDETDLKLILNLFTNSLELIEGSFCFGFSPHLIHLTPKARNMLSYCIKEEILDLCELKIQTFLIQVIGVFPLTFSTHAQLHRAYYPQKLIVAVTLQGRFLFFFNSFAYLPISLGHLKNVL